MRLSMMLKEGKKNAHVGHVDVQSIGLYFFDYAERTAVDPYLGGVVLSSDKRIIRTAYLATHPWQPTKK